MTRSNEENKNRMRETRAEEKEQGQKQDRAALVDAVVDGVVAALDDKLNQIISTIMSSNLPLNQMSGQRKMSCLEEFLQPAPHTPPVANRTGGTHGRSPTMGSGNGRTKAAKREAPTPPTPPTPPTRSFAPPTPLVTPLAPLLPLPRSVPCTPLSPLSLSELEQSTPGAKHSSAKKLLSEIIELVDDVHKIFDFPTEEEDFVAEKKRFYKK